MKKALQYTGRFLLWLVGGAGVLLGLHVIFLLLLIVLMFFLIVLIGPPGDELLLTSVSPTGAYELEVHRINPGATEPYTIRVLRTDDGRDRQIYQMRGEEEAEVEWLSDEVVRINGITLNVPAGETYRGDLHNIEAMTVCITIESEDVYGLELEYGVAREPLGGRGLSNAQADIPLTSDRTYCFTFELAQDFPSEDSLEQGAFWMVLSVYSGDGGGVQLPFLYEWEAGWYRTYQFTLTGSTAEGFALTPDFSACTIVPLEEAFPPE